MKKDDDEQGDLFADFGGDAWARGSDPDTSHDAADDVRGERATKLEAIVVACLKIHIDGLTMHGICAATGLPWNTASPRIRPLVRKGLVYDSGNRRKGPAEKYCIVWKAVTDERTN